MIRGYGYLSLVFAFSFLFCATSTLSFAQEQDSNESAPWSKKRSVTFPVDRSFGTVWIRDVSGMSREEVEALEFIYGDEEWTELGLAEGELELPAKHLAWLKLSGAALSDLSPLLELPPDSIQVLTSYPQHLKGEQLQYIGSLTGLIALNMRYVHASDEHTIYLKNLDQLVSLSWSNYWGSEINGWGITDKSAAFVSSFPRLRELHLRHQPVGNRFCDAVAELPNLKGLTLTSDRVTDAAIATLSKNESIESLALGDSEKGCLVTDEGLKSIGKMRQLRSLNLSSTKISGDGLSELGELKQLQKLTLDRVNVEDAELAHLRPLENLTWLRIYPPNNRRLSDEAAIQISSLTNLERLDANFQIADFGYAHLANLQKLTRIDVSGELKDETVQAVCRMNGLNHITFAGNNNINSEHLAELAKLPSLKTLRLYNSRLDEGSFIQIGKMKELEILSIHETGPTSVLLLEQQNLEAISNLVRLQQFDIHGLDVDERLASILGTFPDLRMIWIQRMNGPIDDAFVKRLADLKRVRNLTFVPGILTDEGLAVLANFKELYSIRINTLATNDGYMQLAELPALGHVSGTSPRVTEDINELISSSFKSIQHSDIRKSAGPPSVSYNVDGFLQLLSGERREVFDNMQGKPAPPMETQYHENVPSMLNMRHFRGKPLVVCFIHRLETLETFHLNQLKLVQEEYGDQANILAIHQEPDQKVLKAFIENNEIVWPTVVDVDMKTIENWNIDRQSSFFIVDQEGMVKYALIHPSEIGPVLESMTADEK